MTGINKEAKNPALKSVAKRWNTVREQQRELSLKDQEHQQGMQDIMSDMSTDPDPKSIEKAELKQMKRLSDEVRKLQEKEQEQGMKEQMDLQIDALKAQHKRFMEIRKNLHDTQRKVLQAQESPTTKKTDTASSSKAAAVAEVPVAEPPAVDPLDDSALQAAPEVKPLNPNFTGPNAIMAALQSIDMDALERESREVIRSGAKTKRPDAVARLNILEGLRRNDMKPKDMMSRTVAVLPPQFRPYSLGDSLIAGDTNILYKDLIETRDAYMDLQDTLGSAAAGDSRLALYDAVKAAHGFGEPVNPKNRERGVSGVLQGIIGKSPKYGVVQRRLLSKPQDNVGRSTIIPDPTLDLDQVGIPEDMAWNIYSAHVVRRMVKGLGHSPAAAIRAVKERDRVAEEALRKEMTERPVIYSRAPSWHRFNFVAGWPRLTKGSAVSISPLVTTGHNADFDGDQMNVHVPTTRESVKEAVERLMPSRMLFSVQDPDRVMPELKHEIITGLYLAKNKKNVAKHTFPDRASALRAIRDGSISMADEITISP